MAAEARQIPIRPQLGAQWRRTSSYLDEHQQYRSPPPPQRQHVDGSHGIDTVIESPQMSPPKSFSRFSGVPSKEDPPRIVEGVSHDFTHPNCAPPPGSKSNRIVATLMYKPRPRPGQNGSHTNLAVPSTVSASATSLPSPPSESDIPANLAPTTNIDAFPLEPPSDAEPEPLDQLYGSYISPLCITSFLHLMSTFPQHPQSDDQSEPVSSHHCLDDPEHPMVVELTLSPAPSPDYLSLADLRKHELVYRFEREWHVDVAIAPDNLWRRHPRLVVFDMDSTLITQEVIDLLAAAVPDRPELHGKVAEITHRAMLGELEFDAAFRQRVELLAGASATIFDDLKRILDVTNGVRPLMRALKRLGCKTAVLSGGFQPLTAHLAADLGIDYAHANEVVVDPATNTLTGEVAGRVVGKERKRELMLEIADKEGIDLRQVVAVGDGANDLYMLGTAGLGVAWNAKPRVQMEASARLNGDTLLSLLYLFGLTSEEIDQLAAE